MCCKAKERGAALEKQRLGKQRLFAPSVEQKRRGEEAIRRAADAPGTPSGEPSMLPTKKESIEESVRFGKVTKI